MLWLRNSADDVDGAYRWWLGSIFTSCGVVRVV